MNEKRVSRMLRIAAICALVGLALMVWGLFDPRPIPIIASMSLGQLFGTLSLLLFVIVVLTDLKHNRVMGHDRPGRDGDADAGRKDADAGRKDADT